MHSEYSDFSRVKVWEEEIVIPTYPAGRPEKDPLFIEHRAYQGSSGKVYPLAVTEKITDEKEDRSYRAVWLENKYIKVMILPELGGRIQRALDKTNGYDFIYYNHVIKPALVGLTGPWISGGIEFNWPQHHRPATYMAADSVWKENADGSASVFVGEIDRMYGTKGMAEIRLYPDRSYIEIRGQLYNRTELPQTFLWWANPAVPVNQETYTVFPPDVTAVMDHGKRAVMTYPIATGEYYKYDYSAGVDISCYRNIEVPTSYMAAHSDYDFIGNFDEGRDAGLLHVADHHIAPGKKQWTWGNSDFGRAWDRNLTDEDGPYIELMTGIYADNQPDFTWLKPYEEKTFTQYFMPYRHTGRVRNATKDAAVSLYADKGESAEAGKEIQVQIRVSTTSEQKNAEVVLKKAGDILFKDTADISPENPYEGNFVLTQTDADCADAQQSLVGCTAEIYAEDGSCLVRYEQKEKKNEPVPDPAEALPAPGLLRSTEECYLAGQHLEQYRHANREPADYYLEGLRRDPTDLRLNHAYGVLLFRRGNFEESIPYLQKAIEKQTWKNPNPYHGEVYFDLGLALVKCGREDEAFDAFYKSIWSAETQSGGFYQMALLCARRGEYAQALEFAEKSLIRNWHNMKVRVLEAALLRKLGDPRKEAAEFLAQSGKIDPLDMGICFEKVRFGLEEESSWRANMRAGAHNYLELALEYTTAGFYKDALTILHACDEESPMIAYYKAYICRQSGNAEKEEEYIREAEALPTDGCFPNRLEEILILQSAVETGCAPHAAYYLGCLFYDRKQYESAAQLWEEAAADAPDLAVCRRNLSIYYYNKKKDADAALREIERALELEPANSRMLMEYDQLLEKTGVDADSRLEKLNAHCEILEDRDVLYLSYITLLNMTGEYEKALNCLMAHRFHPWEGGEGKVSAQYRYALVHLAKEKIEKVSAAADPKSSGEAVSISGELAAARAYLERTYIFPENLGEGRLPSVVDTEADYLLGKVCALEGREDEARKYFEKACSGLEEAGSVLYYNDQPCDTIYYQGLACRELGREKEAKRWFHMLLAYGSRHIFDEVDYDYFAVSLPQIDVYEEDLKQKNTLWCKYLMLLGSRGLGDLRRAEELAAEIRTERPAYQMI